MSAQRNQVACSVQHGDHFWQRWERELLLQPIDFSVKQIKSSILMSLCQYFAKGVFSDKRPGEETNLRRAITSIFVVLKEREWTVIFKLIDAYKDTLKLLQ